MDNGEPIVNNGLGACLIGGVALEHMNVGDGLPGVTEYGGLPCGPVTDVAPVPLVTVTAPVLRPVEVTIIDPVVMFTVLFAAVIAVAVTAVRHATSRPATTAQGESDA